jgi:hypothetical protein
MYVLGRVVSVLPAVLAGALVVLGCCRPPGELSDGGVAEPWFLDVSGRALGRNVTPGDVEEDGTWFGGLLPPQLATSNTITSTTATPLTP